MLARTPQEQQQAAHVTDYRLAAALQHLRSIGACGRKTRRAFTDDQFDDNQFSIENGDGEIY